MRESRVRDEAVVMDQARHGDRDAFDTLYERHATSAWRFGMAVERRSGAATRGVVEAFAKVLSRNDLAVDLRVTPLRVELLAAVRNAALDASRDEVTARPEPTVGSGERAACLEHLPERWRTVLWLRDVEGLEDGEVAAVLGVSAVSAARLHERAQSGIRAQLAEAQIRSATTGDCRRTTARLGGYAVDSLSSRDTVRVRRHLDRCGECRGRLDEVDDLPARMRDGVPPRPAAMHDLAAQAWAARTAAPSGWLGITLPGGRPVPMWAERAIAGATAAAVALGITGAVVAGSRGTRNGNAPRALDRTDHLYGLPDGESALGGDISPFEVLFDIDVPGVTPTGSDRADGSGGAPGSGDATHVPRSPDATRPPATLSAPTEPEGPAVIDPPPDEPPPTTTTTAPPVASVAVTDDTGVSVGGDCTGAEILGTTVGCTPPASSTLA